MKLEFPKLACKENFLQTRNHTLTGEASIFNLEIATINEPILMEEVNRIFGAFCLRNS